MESRDGRIGSGHSGMRPSGTFDGVGASARTVCPEHPPGPSARTVCRDVASGVPSYGMRPRSVIDYALARRATLADLHAGRVSTADVCDAHPYLLRAARYHGEPTTRRCPVCRCHDPLTGVTYIYGDELGVSSGRVRATRELPSLAQRFGELRVYVVEVCTSCGWNHLTTSFVIGTGQSRGRRNTRRRAAEE